MQISVLLYISLVILAGEQKEIAYFNNLLLENIELRIDITLVSTPEEVSTPSLLNSTPPESLRNTKTKSYIAKNRKPYRPKVRSSGFKTSEISNFNENQK